MLTKTKQAHKSDKKTNKTRESNKTMPQLKEKYQ